MVNRTCSALEQSKKGKNQIIKKTIERAGQK